MHDDKIKLVKIWIAELHGIRSSRHQIKKFMSIKFYVDKQIRTGAVDKETGAELKRMVGEAAIRILTQ